MTKKNISALSLRLLLGAALAATIYIEKPVRESLEPGTWRPAKIEKSFAGTLTRSTTERLALKCGQESGHP